MDPLTQGLLGATAAQSIGAKKLPNSAWKIGFLAGIAADADIIIRSPWDPMLFLQYHRYFTHALAFIPLGGAFIALLCLLFFKQLRPHKWLVLLISMIAYATHGLLDATTSYGTVLLWPFSNVRYAWDIMSIIDPIFTIVLFSMLVLSILRRSTAIAIVGLGLSLVYIGFGVIQHHRALEAQAEQAKGQGHVITKARVMPILGHLFAWRGVYASQQQLYFTRIQTPLFHKATAQPVMSTPRFTRTYMPKALLHTQTLSDNFKVFEWFTDDYMFLASTSPLVICDGRYFLNYQQPTCMWGIAFPASAGQGDYVKFLRNIPFDGQKKMR